MISERFEVAMAAKSLGVGVSLSHLVGSKSPPRLRVLSIRCFASNPFFFISPPFFLPINQFLVHDFYSKPFFLLVVYDLLTLESEHILCVYMGLEEIDQFY